MRKPITVKPKRGRPPTGGRDPFVGIRLPQELIGTIDDWGLANKTKSRSEAVRRLVELGLAAGAKSLPSQRLQVARGNRAKELASKAIDSVSDDRATAVDQASRKRRLLKGPEEFRAARVDLPKAKK